MQAHERISCLVSHCVDGKDVVKVALIVGAGPGLGGAVARRFALDGYYVCVARRKAESLQRLVQEIESSGGQAKAFGCDARKEDQVKHMVDTIESSIGAISFFCFNVGANVRFEVVDTTERVFRKVWEMACLAGFLCCREVAAYMKSRGKGTIIVTGATASLRGAAGYAAFGSAKAALRSFSQTLAREMAPLGIHVCHTIIDGAIDTPWVRKMWKDATEDDLMRPDAIADIYHSLHQQKRSAWSNEIDIRPYAEKW